MPTLMNTTERDAETGDRDADREPPPPLPLPTDHEELADLLAPTIVMGRD